MAGERYTREKLAADLMQDVQGLDSPNRAGHTNMSNGSSFGFDAGHDGFFDADGTGAAGDLWPVELIVPAGQALDITILRNSHYDLAALPTFMSSPAIADYKEMVRFVHSNPIIINQLQIISTEPQTGGPVINSLKLVKEKKNPLQATASNERPVSALKSSQDYQANVFNLALKYTMDTWQYLRFKSAVNPVGNPDVALTLNFFIGARVELKQLLAPVAGRVQGTVNRAGQRGRAPAGQ